MVDKTFDQQALEIARTELTSEAYATMRDDPRVKGVYISAENVLAHYRKVLRRLNKERKRALAAPS